MSKNKNFTQIATSKFLSTQTSNDTDNTQHTQTVQDTQKINKVGKNPRINMAFSSDLLEYLQIMARLEGCSITQYCNNLIRKDKIERISDYNNALSLFNLNK